MMRRTADVDDAGGHTTTMTATARDLAGEMKGGPWGCAGAIGSGDDVDSSSGLCLSGAGAWTANGGHVVVPPTTRVTNRRTRVLLLLLLLLGATPQTRPWDYFERAILGSDSGTIPYSCFFVCSV